MNTDDCVEHACANGGVCVDGVGNYTCQCPLQYTGKHGGGQSTRLSPVLWVEGLGPPQRLQEVLLGLASLLPIAPYSPRKGL